MRYSLIMERNNDILSRISHEIRTPLNSIMGLNRIIQENPGDTDVVKDCASKISLASSYIVSLVNNIIEIDELSPESARLNPQVFSIKKLLDTICITYETAAKDAGLAFQCTVSEPFPEFVLADNVRLGQVFANLLSNAIRFNKTGGHVDFIAEDVGAAGKEHTLRFTVSDSGVGISPDLLKKLFTPFVNVASEGKDTVYGAGMGLAVVNKIVTMMDSKIHVRSIEDEGSTFWFEIKVPVPDAEECAPVEGQHELEGCCILVADDNNVNCDITRHLLEGWGCKVEVTNRGEDAVALFAASEPGHYDAILLDIRMPGMDGLEACKKIRALGGEGSFSINAVEIPIIAMTANALESEREQSFQVGMNAHISKPIDPDELYTVLAANIRR